MRNHQPWLAGRAVVEEQNVQIERARAVDDAGRPVASELQLNGQQAKQQSFRLKFRLQRNHGIHKTGLLGESHRLG